MLGKGSSWGRGGLGTAAPLVLRIPGGNGIFRGSRAPGRNSKAAFGARRWLSHWAPALRRWHREVGFRWGGCSFWAREGIAVTCKRAKLRAGRWEQSRVIVWVQPRFGAQALFTFGHQCRLRSRGTKFGHLVPQFPPLQSCLLRGFGWLCCQRGLPAAAGSALPAPRGKRHFPCLAHGRARREVKSRPLYDLPAGHLPLVTVSLPESRAPPCSEQLHGLGAAPCPMAAQFPPLEGLILQGASLGKPSYAWASSACPASGFVLTRDAPGRASKNVPQGHAHSPLHPTPLSVPLHGCALCWAAGPSPCHGLPGTDCPHPHGCACAGGRAGVQHYPSPASARPPHSRAQPRGWLQQTGAPRARGCARGSK